MFYFYILAIFWFIRTFRSFLFWLYLWQLKEYHFGRFLDHFRTEKGKRLLLNKLLFLKIALALILFYCIFFSTSAVISSFVVFFIIFLYFIESIIAVKNFFQKKIKAPVLTQKTVILILIGLLVQILFLFLVFYNFHYLIKFAFALLVFDTLMPIIASIIVFIFQPFTILLRNRILKKAKIKREQFKNLLVIGITGSYGKTSTKEFLATILSSKFKVLKTKNNNNSEIGISRCILKELKPEHQIFICEMAAYNRGGIKLLCDIAKPKIGIITGVNEQHLATFGSMENLLSAEGGGELIDSLPQDGIAFFNAKNKYCQKLYKKLVEDRDQRSLLKTEVNKVNKGDEDKSSSLRFADARVYGEEAIFMGEENILGAMAVAKELGMSEQEIDRAVERIENKFPGIQLKKVSNDLTIINATYSANPTGVMAHLEYLKKWSGRKIIIMRCLIELGSASKKVHYEIGEKLGGICDLAIITTKERFNEIEQGAINSGMKKENILFLEDPRLIIQKLKESLLVSDTNKLVGIRYQQTYRQTSGSVVLLEGRISKQIIDIIEKGF